MAFLQSVTPRYEIVGKAFVEQYYHILCHSPVSTFRFYRDDSKLSRAERNGVTSITTTVQAIKEKIISFHRGDFGAEILTVDAQESYNGGVIVFVTGFLTWKDRVRRGFIQNFFLAPQLQSYFILNDMFRYVGDDKLLGVTRAPFNNVVAPRRPSGLASDLRLQEEYYIPKQVVESDTKVEDAREKYCALVRTSEDFHRLGVLGSSGTKGHEDVETMEVAEKIDLDTWVVVEEDFELV